MTATALERPFAPVVAHPAPRPVLRRAPSPVESTPRVLVVIPTYCESATIAQVLRRTRVALPTADVLVVDDNSPDGTADRVERAAVALHNIAVLHRLSKQGLGEAYRVAFGYASVNGYDVVVEMDADLSHDPAALPALVAAVGEGADLAIGSRYVPGASIPDWPWHRRALSRFGNLYARTLLRVPVADLTSGFRAFRVPALRAIGAEESRSTGYAFQIELAYEVARRGGRIVELPITFRERRLGASKMSGLIPVEALARVTQWALRDRLGSRRVV